MNDTTHPVKYFTRILEYCLINKNKMSVHKKELITDGVKRSVLSVIPEGVLGGGGA